MSEIFTPIDAATGERLHFATKDIEVLSGNLFKRGLGVQAMVRIADTVYTVVGISCGIDTCQCDAEIRAVVTKPALAKRSSRRRPSARKAV